MMDSINVNVSQETCHYKIFRKWLSYNARQFINYYDPDVTSHRQWRFYRVYPETETYK